MNLKTVCGEIQLMDHKCSEEPISDRKEPQTKIDRWVVERGETYRRQGLELLCDGDPEEDKQNPFLIPL